MVENRKTKYACEEVKGRKGRTDMGHRVTSSLQVYCRDNDTIKECGVISREKNKAVNYTPGIQE